MAEPGDAEVDRGVLTDAQGRPWVPASALAGSLRHHLGDSALRLMGREPGDDAGGDAAVGAGASAASPLWIVGTSVEGTPRVVTTTQTAIDRHRRSARPKTLRISDVVESRTDVWVYLRHDGSLDRGDLASIASWRPRIGRGRSVGLGTGRLVDLRQGEVDLRSPAGRRTWLSLSGPELWDAVATAPVKITGQSAQPWMAVTLEIVDGLRVGNGQDSETKVLVAARHGSKPYVPGSTWKGVLRSRAEYVLRSIGEPACDTLTGCGECRTCNLFGSSGRRGLLRVRGSEISGAMVEKRTHVAIDRFTGGARPGQLYTAEVVTSGSLRLEISRDGDVDGADRRLIAHVLRDLQDGVVAVGARTSTGLGTLRVVGTEPAGLIDDPGSPGAGEES